jgi:hypothetical protein
MRWRNSKGQYIAKELPGSPLIQELFRDEPNDGSEPELDQTPEEHPVSGFDFISNLADRRAGDRVTKVDFMLQFLNSIDLEQTDPKLIQLFKSSGIPRRIVPLIGCLDKGMPWFKDLRKLFREQIKTEGGAALQDSIQSFMTSFHQNAQMASAHATMAVVIHELIQFRDATQLDTQEHLISARTVKFWKEYLWTEDDALEESFKDWITARSADTTVDLSISTHLTPGGKRLRPNAHGSGEHMLDAAEAMIKFISPRKHLDVSIGTLIDQLLIRGREGHPKIMRKNQTAESWIEEEQAAVDNIDFVAASIGKRAVQVSDIDRCENLQSACNSALWTIIEDKLLDMEADFCDLDFMTAKNWLLDAQTRVEKLKANRSGRKKSNCFDFKKEDSAQETEESGDPKKGKKKKNKNKNKKRDEDGPEEESGPPADPPTPEKASEKKGYGPTASKTEHQSEQDRRAMLEARALMDCYHWINGDCTRGSRCHYRHADDMKGKPTAKQAHEIQAVPNPSIPPSNELNDSDDDEFEIERESTFDSRNPKQVAVINASKFGNESRFSPIKVESESESDSEEEETEDSMGQTEWALRMKSKFEKSSEIAKLTEKEIPELLPRRDRAARNIPKSQWTSEGPERMMLLTEDIGGENHAALDASSLYYDNSIDLHSEDENEKKGKAPSGQLSILNFLQVVIPAKEEEVAHKSVSEFFTENDTDMEGLCFCSSGKDNNHCEQCEQCTVCCECNDSDDSDDEMEEPESTVALSTNSDEYGLCTCDYPIGELGCTRCLQCPGCCNCQAQHQALIDATNSGPHFR